MNFYNILMGFHGFFMVFIYISEHVQSEQDQQQRQQQANSNDNSETELSCF